MSILALAICDWSQLIQSYSLGQRVHEIVMGVFLFIGRNLQIVKGRSRDGNILCLKIELFEPNEIGCYV